LPDVIKETQFADRSQSPANHLNFVFEALAGLQSVPLEKQIVFAVINTTANANRVRENFDMLESKYPRLDSDIGSPVTAL